MKYIMCKDTNTRVLCYYVNAESKAETNEETEFNNDDYEPIQVHVVETDPFIDEGFELIPEYELE